LLQYRQIYRYANFGILVSVANWISETAQISVNFFYISVSVQQNNISRFLVWTVWTQI